MKIDYNKHFRSKVKDLKKKNTFINLKTINSPIGSEIKIDKKRYINLASNNYLGLANNARMKKAAKRAIDNYGIGPAAVRTISGNTTLHVELEESLSDFKKIESAVTFQTGFLANLAVIPSVIGENGMIFSDELNHASIIDGCRLSKAAVVRFRHCNTDDLEKKLKNHRKTKIKLIATDGVFSMDGDIAPLDKLYRIAKKYNAMLMVDDAHGEGVLGRNGRGIVDHFDLHGRVDIEVGTFSKAFGVIGGYAAGKREIIDWLKQRSRPFLFSSAMTIPDTAACIQAIKILETSDKLVNKLWKNGEYFKNELLTLGFDTGTSQTPITPILLGEEKTAQIFANKLFENNVFITAITYPTVPKGKARLRAMISASHTKRGLDHAIGKIKQVGKQMGVI